MVNIYLVAIGNDGQFRIGKFDGPNAKTAPWTKELIALQNNIKERKRLVPRKVNHHRIFYREKKDEHFVD
jgi:hypothetical protein